MRKVLFVYDDPEELMSSSRWRCLWPAEGLNRYSQKWQADVVSIDDFHEMPYRPYHALVIERPTFNITHARTKFRCPVVVSFDDAYHALPAYGLPHDVWLHRDALRTLKANIALADAVVTSSPKLTAHYAPRNGVTIPNYHLIETPPKKERKAVAGWGGSQYHWSSFARYRDDVEQIVRDRNFTLEIIAHNKVFQAFDVPKQFVDPCEYKKYLDVMSSWSLGFAAVYGEYDSFRTPIKALEYCVLDIPYVAWGELYEDWQDQGAEWRKEQGKRYHMEKGVKSWEELLASL